MSKAEAKQSQLGLFIEDDLHMQLKRAALDERKSVSVVVRDLIVQWLDERKKANESI